MEIAISIITLVCVAIAAFAIWKAHKANQKLHSEIAHFIDRLEARGKM